MTDATVADQQHYHVVVNDEEQYSIWPVELDLPDGWRATGHSGVKDDCLAHIGEVWTDMRPLSLRRYLETLPDDEPADAAAPDEEEQEPSLVDRLTVGQHPVTAVARPENSAAALGEAVERGYVFVRFTGTRGGTELGLALDRDASDLSGGDFAAGTGTVTLVGSLTLDFEPVRCRARIDLATLTGEGGLERTGGDDGAAGHG